MVGNCPLKKFFTVETQIKDSLKTRFLRVQNSRVAFFKQAGGFYEKKKTDDCDMDSFNGRCARRRRFCFDGRLCSRLGRVVDRHGIDLCR